MEQGERRDKYSKFSLHACSKTSEDPVPHALIILQGSFTTASLGCSGTKVRHAAKPAITKPNIRLARIKFVPLVRAGTLKYFFWTNQYNNFRLD